MSVTAASFRVDYPEFQSSAAFPSSAINYYLAYAGLLLNKVRWGQPSATADTPPTTMYDMATELFVAHFVTIEATAQKDAQNNVVPGRVKGPLTGESVGPVSVSFDSASVVNKDAGHWNLTQYGLRFWQLASLFGMGPVQIGIGFDCTPFNGPAWPGPVVAWPGWGTGQ